jgi:hypothetical protein
MDMVERRLRRWIGLRRFGLGGFGEAVFYG